MEGSGKMLVLAVGEHSQTGMIFKLLGATEDADEGEPKKAASQKKGGKRTSVFSALSMLPAETDCRRLVQMRSIHEN